MTKDEFLKLLGKGQPDADEKLIAAVEKVLKDGVPSDNVKHTDTIDAFAAAYDVLEHYGVDGQQWGVRNGPPYPLSRKKRAKLTKASKAKEVLKNIDYLSVDEIQNWIKRIELEEKLESMTKDDRQKGQSYVMKILQKSGDAILSSVVPAVTTFAFKKLIESVAGEETAKDMFPKKK